MEEIRDALIQAILKELEGGDIRATRIHELVICLTAIVDRISSK